MLLNRGEYVRCAALGEGPPPYSMVRVWFRNANNAEIALLMSSATYDAIPLLEPATPQDYRDIGFCIAASP